MNGDVIGLCLHRARAIACTDTCHAATRATTVITRMIEGRSLTTTPPTSHPSDARRVRVARSPPGGAIPVAMGPSCLIISMTLYRHGNFTLLYYSVGATRQYRYLWRNGWGRGGFWLHHASRGAATVHTHTVWLYA